MLGSSEDMLLFARIVELGGLAAAAREAEVSRALVSKRLNALELRLGTRLLHRTTRQISLTESGEVFYGYCQRLRATLEEASERISELGGQPRGLLRLSTPVTFGERYVAPLLAEFAAQYPQVQFELTLDDHYTDLVQEGIDVAIRVGALDDSTLVARRLASMRLHTLVAPTCLARHGEPRHPGELAGLPCLTYRHPRGRSSEWEFASADGTPLRVHVSGPLRANGGHALRAAACAGLGFVQLPDFIAVDDVRAGRLLPVLEDWSIGDIGVHAVMPSPRPPAKTRAFIDFLRARYADRPWTLAPLTAAVSAAQAGDDQHGT
ncbi:LysR family transcriptional regulator [Plasticicumulans acidivorans]|uniref:DNA-binding transcriptional LysR family regulator n=1 Tax=Plasticicumulans acidivorans TaxID=886464 RepID=A0A317MYW1_9GAMM|nr:LysR family transcriptional regulator [Plasticicumulans acidivorans]PWV64542.1 DNA-binding transcriptional LysR family regulator [Plasticicumulans acidivorans]